ncbi:MAG: hypothetical protein NTY48_00895 [Candidatus Diapherotrites archaeon]|nr:hypothetical protein [Candidatus Diapherotrites archaeon]
MGKYYKKSQKRKTFPVPAFLCTKSGERAQAAAPFELFVAVIIMAFVLVIGYKVLDEATTAACLNKVDKEMTGLISNIRDTVVTRSSNLFSFQPDTKCFSSKESSLKIYMEKNGRVCSAVCQKPLEECFIITFSNPALANATRQKCIDIPTYTSFMSEESCSMTDAPLQQAGFDIINPQSDMGQGILRGQYVIRNISPGGDTYPKICVWYKAA